MGIGSLLPAAQLSIHCSADWFSCGRLVLSIYIHFHLNTFGKYGEHLVSLGYFQIFVPCRTFECPCPKNPGNKPRQSLGRKFCGLQKGLGGNQNVGKSQRVWWQTSLELETLVGDISWTWVSGNQRWQWKIHRSWLTFQDFQLPCLIYRTVPADSSQFVPLLGWCRILEVHLITRWESDQQTRWQCSPSTVLASAEHRWTKQAHWGWKWHVGHRWILFFQILTAWHHQPIINHRTAMDLATLVPTKTHPMPPAHDYRRSQCFAESRPGGCH